MEPVGAVWLVSDVRATPLPFAGILAHPEQDCRIRPGATQCGCRRIPQPLRHHPHGSQPLHLLPLTQKDNPAVQAASGERGILYGHDYRGEEVLSMVSTVPDSPCWWWCPR